MAETEVSWGHRDSEDSLEGGLGALPRSRSSLSEAKTLISSEQNSLGTPRDQLWSRKGSPSPEKKQKTKKQMSAGSKAAEGNLKGLSRKGRVIEIPMYLEKETGDVQGS